MSFLDIFKTSQFKSEIEPTAEFNKTMLADE